MLYKIMLIIKLYVYVGSFATEMKISSFETNDCNTINHLQHNYHIFLPLVSLCFLVYQASENTGGAMKKILIQQTHSILCQPST